MYYAGIGSRQTPTPVLELMTAIATGLKTKGYVLRSGGANGADTAFHRGAQGQAEIFLPWAGYNSAVIPCAKDVTSVSPPASAVKMAARYHPAWDRLSRGPRALHARNMQIILGESLDSPVKWVICWTPNGEVTGGTGQALRLAESLLIPVYNLGVPELFERAKSKYLEAHERILMTEGEGL